MMMFDAGPVFAMGATAEGASPLVQVIPFVLILAIFYFVILLPMKKKQAKVTEFLGALKVDRPDKFWEPSKFLVLVRR